jgi:SAM-dependent methyltransferase
MKPLALYDVPPLYDLVVQPGPCERFYRDLAGRVGGPILELASGTGRLTIPLALDGHEIVGLDASHPMLRSAREKADAEDVEITFVHGDMRDFSLGRIFALVIISCNSLGHLTQNEELKSCLRSVARHLAPGGLLAFDIVNPPLHDLGRPMLGPCGSISELIQQRRSQSRRSPHMIQCSRSALHNGASSTPAPVFARSRRFDRASYFRKRPRCCSTQLASSSQHAMAISTGTRSRAIA